jgi:hypothetical protein
LELVRVRPLNMVSEWSDSGQPNATADGRFEWVRELGQGATGRVFEVYDRLHDARCALKQFRTDRRLDADHFAAFKGEFRKLAELTHPNLAKVYELLVTNAQPSLLMELLDGVDFVQYVRSETAAAPLLVTQSEEDSPIIPARGGTLCEERLRKALPQLASGVLALHAHGSVHCDLKPENALVERSGRVVIVDFGLLSAPAHERSGPTRKARGTPHYMAPEQMDGWPSEVSDWYAFGVVLYLALTGRLPFSGPSKTLEYEKRFNRPVHPRHLAPEAPADLCELSLRLLAPDPRKRPSGAAVARALGLDSVHEVSPRGMDEPFVGRTGQIETLELALQRARAGAVVVTFVHGDSGIGKTTLVAHFLDKLRRRDQRVCVLRGSCYQGVSVPYKGFDMIMDQIAADSAHDILLKGLDLEGLATMFPVFGPGATPPVEMSPGERRARATAAVRQLLQRLSAAATTVIFIDDFQWTDDETIELLSDSMRDFGDGSLLLIIGHRGHGGHSDTGLGRARKQLGFDYDIEVQPLGRTEVRELVTTLLSRKLDSAQLSASKRDDIAQDCAGNPLLIRQLAGSLLTPGRLRASLDDVIANNLSELDDLQRSYVELVSIAPRPVPEQALAKILRASGAELLTARHDLMVRCFIKRADTRIHTLEPYHEQIRERVVRTLSLPQMRRHHSQLAAALERLGGTEPETLALHYRGAGDLTKAARYTESAAEAAEQALAFEHAARLYASAIELCEGDEADRLRIKRGQALSNAGRPLESAALFLDVATRRPADLDLRLSAGDELLRAGRMDDGLQLLREIARHIGERIPESAWFTLLQLLWNGWRAHRTRIPEAALARQLDALALCASVGRRLAMTEPVAAALFQRRYLRHALAHGSSADIARGLALEASMCAHMPAFAPGGPARAEALTVRSHQLLQGQDAPDVRATACFATAMVAYARGHFRACRIELERGVEILRHEVIHGVRADVAVCESFIAFMLWMEGDVPSIRTRLPSYMTRATGDLSLETALVDRVSVMLALCEDQPLRARALADTMIAKWPAGPFRLQHYFDAVAQIEINLYERSGRQGYERAQRTWAQAKRAGIFQQRFFVPFSQAQRGRAALACGELGAAQRDADALMRGEFEWAKGLGRMISAAVADARNEHGRSELLLEQAANELKHWDLKLYWLAVRHRQGLRGANALAELAALGVREPERLVATLLPWAN